MLKDAGYGGKSLFAEEDEEDDGKLDDEVLYILTSPLCTFYRPECNCIRFFVLHGTQQKLS